MFFKALWCRRSFISISWYMRIHINNLVLYIHLSGFIFVYSEPGGLHHFTASVTSANTQCHFARRQITPTNWTNILTTNNARGAQFATRPPPGAPGNLTGTKQPPAPAPIAGQPSEHYWYHRQRSWRHYSGKYCADDSKKARKWRSPPDGDWGDNRCVGGKKSQVICVSMCVLATHRLQCK